MKKLIATLTVIGALMSIPAHAAFPGEQVWDAEISNSQQTCGIDYPSGSTRVGGILTQGETGSTGSKGITFYLKTNAKNMSWKITEAKLTQNTGRYDFDDNLMNVSDVSKTSIFVNDQEYAWSQVNQERVLTAKAKTLTLAPKINMLQQDLPLGTTHIQGKIVVTCSN